MGLEIERKFLTKNDDWKNLATGTLYRQGYLNSDKGRTVRVRTVGDTGYITIKGPTIENARLEFEYQIPIGDANQMLDTLCTSSVVEKLRHKIDYQGFTWEVDQFLLDNEGLIVAEIELEHVEQSFPIPPWIGREVSDDPRFYNANLACYPFCNWRDTPA